MKHSYTSLALALAATWGLVFTGGVYACGGGDECGSASLKVSRPCAAFPFLSPGNDVRLNAMLLMVKPAQLKVLLSDSPAADGTNIPPGLYDYRERIETYYRKEKRAEASAPAADEYAEGEGNIRRSVGSANQDFYAAIKSASLPNDEVSQLQVGRTKMLEACAAENKALYSWEKPVEIKSLRGRQFLTYLDSACHFYSGNFEQAAKIFSSLKESTNPWLKEVSRYMVGRAELNQAQARAFGDRGYDGSEMFPEKVDQQALNKAAIAFEDYLRSYPTGKYADSARGLLQRRINWLANNKQKLATFYEQVLQNWTVASSELPMRLADEFESKLLQSISLETIEDSQIQSPYIGALVVLRMLPRENFTIAKLQAKEKYFSTMPELYRYLLASYHLYKGNEPQKAVALLPELSPTVSRSLEALPFSQQIVRALALEDSGQIKKAEQLWMQLMGLTQDVPQRQLLELALAIHWEHTGQLNRIFEKGSLVQDTRIRTILLYHDADAELLRQQAQNQHLDASLREIALYTLLYKELTRGHYQAFLADLKLIPTPAPASLQPFILGASMNDEGYVCPSVRDTATKLKQSPHNARGLNCLALFVKNYPPLDSHISDENIYPKREYKARKDRRPQTFLSDQKERKLGEAPSQFEGKGYARMDSYLQVIDNVRAPAVDRAYALYRAIRCFAPSGRSECGGDDIPISTRNQWFSRLKSTYGKSVWADSLKYYW